MAVGPKFMTLSKASPILGISQRPLLAWVGKHIVPAYHPDPKGVYLVDVAEVEEAIKARAAQAQQAPALTKERFKDLMDGFKAEIAREKKFTVQQVMPGKRVKKAPLSKERVDEIMERSRARIAANRKAKESQHDKTVH